MAQNFYLIDGKYVPATHTNPKKSLVKEVAVAQKEQKELVEEVAIAEEAKAPNKEIHKINLAAGTTRVELKAHLDSLGIEYKQNAPEKKLLELLAPHVTFVPAIEPEL